MDAYLQNPRRGLHVNPLQNLDLGNEKLLGFRFIFLCLLRTVSLSSLQNSFLCFPVYMIEYGYFPDPRHMWTLSLNSKRKSNWLNLRQMASPGP